MDSGAQWTTIAMILFVVVGCILTVFLGYLVRSAYDMRIGLKAQLDRGLKQVEEDSAKKARQLRQELGNDIERARTGLFEEARKRLGEASANVETRWLEFERAGKQERIDTAMTLDALRDEISMLTRRIDDLERELLIGGAEAEPPLTPVTPTAASTTAGAAAATARFTTGTAAPIGSRPATGTTASLRFEPHSATKVAAG